MKRFPFAILVAYALVTANIYAYEPSLSGSNPSMLRLPPAEGGSGDTIIFNGYDTDDSVSTYLPGSLATNLVQNEPTLGPVSYQQNETDPLYPEMVEPIPESQTGGHLVGSSSFMPQFRCRDLWHLQILPQGLLYQPYMASAHEERMAGQWVEDQNWGWIWDVALGGRVGILRYGNDSASRPEGWQVDLGGAAFPRLQLNHDLDVVSCDYKFSLPISYSRGRHATRFGYYHLSSHLGDEYMIKHPDARRINYSRDCLLLGHSIYFRDRTMRIYAEAAWAFQTGDMTKPWEFQFGFEYAPNHATGTRPEPFFAIGGHLREEVDFGGNMIVQTGLLWQGVSNQRFRIGLQYYVGMSDQYEFIDQYENKVGFGIWYDF